MGGKAFYTINIREFMCDFYEFYETVKTTYKIMKKIKANKKRVLAFNWFGRNDKNLLWKFIKTLIICYKTW